MGEWATKNARETSAKFLKCFSICQARSLSSRPSFQVNNRFPAIFKSHSHLRHALLIFGESLMKRRARRYVFREMVVFPKRPPESPMREKRRIQHVLARFAHLRFRLLHRSAPNVLATLLLKDQRCRRISQFFTNLLKSS